MCWQLAQAPTRQLLQASVIETVYTVSDIVCQSNAQLIYLANLLALEIKSGNFSVRLLHSAQQRIWYSLISPLLLMSNKCIL